jgi:hypothetical protein
MGKDFRVNSVLLQRVSTAGKKLEAFYLEKGKSMICRISDLNDNFELDPKTHWVKAFRSDGDFYLIEPRAAMQLSIWSAQQRMALMQSQEILDQEKK